MSLNIHGPGMLWVQSRIAPESTNVLKESTFLQWYDEEHIPEVVSTTGIKDGFRYVDAHKSIPSEDSANSKPFLALYPMSDLAFTLGDEFRKISVTSDKLPGSGMIYDMAEFDISYMGLLGMIGNHSEKASALLSCGIRPIALLEKHAVSDFLAKQVTQVSKMGGYLRTLSFELQYARTNAQSRALKGLPTTDEPVPEPMTWLAIHEFSQDPGEIARTEIERITMDSMESHGWGTAFEVRLWLLAATHGQGKFFATG